jgi:hypothetical protein
VVKDGVRKAVSDRQNALTDLVHAIQKYRKLADSTPLTLRAVASKSDKTNDLKIGWWIRVV